ncbi:MAG: hypothetical protein J1F64_07185 [Oscillospiraceae bacterium]|nr:hypothetical protein [Oscillospiraceae bacterium]
MRNFEIKLMVRENKKGEVTESIFTAEVKMCDTTNFSEIVDFTDSVKAI